MTLGQDSDSNAEKDSTISYQPSPLLNLCLTSVTEALKAVSSCRRLSSIQSLFLFLDTEKLKPEAYYKTLLTVCDYLDNIVNEDPNDVAEPCFNSIQHLQIYYQLTGLPRVFFSKQLKNLNETLKMKAIYFLKSYSERIRDQSADIVQVFEILIAVVEEESDTYSPSLKSNALDILEDILLKTGFVKTNLEKFISSFCPLLSVPSCSEDIKIRCLVTISKLLEKCSKDAARKIQKKILRRLTIVVEDPDSGISYCMKKYAMDCLFSMFRKFYSESKQKCDQDILSTLFSVGNSVGEVQQFQEECLIKIKDLLKDRECLENACQDNDSGNGEPENADAFIILYKVVQDTSNKYGKFLKKTALDMSLTGMKVFWSGDTHNRFIELCATSINNPKFDHAIKIRCLATTKNLFRKKQCIENETRSVVFNLLARVLEEPQTAQPVASNGQEAKHLFSLSREALEILLTNVEAIRCEEIHVKYIDLLWSLFNDSKSQEEIKVKCLKQIFELINHEDTTKLLDDIEDISLPHLKVLVNSSPHSMLALDCLFTLFTMHYKNKSVLPFDILKFLFKMMDAYKHVIRMQLREEIKKRVVIRFGNVKKETAFLLHLLEESTNVSASAKVVALHILAKADFQTNLEQQQEDYLSKFCTLLANKSIDKDDRNSCLQGIIMLLNKHDDIDYSCPVFDQLLSTLSNIMLTSELDCTAELKLLYDCGNLGQKTKMHLYLGILILKYQKRGELLLDVRGSNVGDDEVASPKTAVNMTVKHECKTEVKKLCHIFTRTRETPAVHQDVINDELFETVIEILKSLLADATICDTCFINYQEFMNAYFSYPRFALHFYRNMLFDILVELEHCKLLEKKWMKVLGVYMSAIASNEELFQAFCEELKNDTSEDKDDKKIFKILCLIRFCKKPAHIYQLCKWRQCHEHVFTKMASSGSTRYSSLGVIRLLQGLAKSRVNHQRSYQGDEKMARDNLPCVCRMNDVTRNLYIRVGNGRFQVSREALEENCGYFRVLLDDHHWGVQNATLIDLKTELDIALCFIHLLHGCDYNCPTLTTTLAGNLKLADELFRTLCVYVVSEKIRQNFHQLLVQYFFNSAGNGVMALLCTALENCDTVFIELAVNCILDELEDENESIKWDLYNLLRNVCGKKCLGTNYFIDLLKTLVNNWILSMQDF